MIRYCASSLDLKRKYDVTPEKFLGIPIDLIDVDQYGFPEEYGRTLDPADKKLFQRESSSKLLQMRGDKAPTPWLRKQKILDNNLYGRTNNHISKAEVGRQQALQVEKLRLQRKKDESRETQISRIMQSFNDAKTVSRHPKNPKLKPVSVLKVLPNLELLANAYTLTKFKDTNNYSVTKEDAKIGVEELIIKCNSTEEHVVYTKSDAKKPVESKPGYDVQSSDTYDWTREYKRDPATRSTGDNTMFFYLKPDGVEYGRYRKKLNLRQREQNIKLQEELIRRPRQLTVTQLTRVSDVEEKTQKSTDEKGDGSDNIEEDTNKTEEPVMGASVDDDSEEEAL